MVAEAWRGTYQGQGGLRVVQQGLRELGQVDGFRDLDRPSVQVGDDDVQLNNRERAQGHTHTQTDRQTDTHTHMHTHTDRQTDRAINISTNLI